MEIPLKFLLLVLIGSLAVTLVVQAQEQIGFISLDCGLPPQVSPYNETQTGLTFISDTNFVDTGESRRIKKEYETEFLKPFRALRSFPEGKRNCYNLNVTNGTNYLIRTRFVYGNYDDQNESPSFDLYLGPNKWVSVDNEASNNTFEEIIHVARSNHLQVCLVKTGTGIPFISALELRPMAGDTYITERGSLMHFFRLYLNTTSDPYIRYADDVHDRTWTPYFQEEWTQISTTLNVSTSNGYDPPQAAMKTAATPTNFSEPLTITWTFDDPNTQMYLYMHFAEIEELKANETREFNITLNGKVTFGPLIPSMLKTETIYYRRARTCGGGKCVWQLVKTPRSTHPPLLNAIEAFTVIDFPQSETDQTDVDAIKTIKAMYGLSRTSWQGDPCAPKEYSWDGLNCSYKAVSDPPRITSLNLSSSGLNGIIPPYIQNLTELKELDLSNNKLFGGVPDFLAEMNSLLVINLSGNNLNGSVPQALRDRETDGLQLNVEGNPNLYCPTGSCKNKKKKFLVPVVGSVASFTIVILALALFLVLIRKKKLKSTEATQLSPTMAFVGGRSHKSSELSMITKERRFTYSEVLRMTNNFERILGRGGFAVVYHGYLNDIEQVAVKLLSQSSAQDYKQFKAEIELLLRVHHKNLVSLVGYCDEGDNLALIYEYMENGDLKEHLSGKRSSGLLSWASRLNIAAEAAQGLEYLHNGCKPHIVHRDVKTTNILLNKHFRAKLGDFGLSRSFPIEGESHVSTVVAGTPGYLDPEYYRTNWLTEKSDVYSFGVALLEIITNRPVIHNSRERRNIAEWVGFMLNKGDIKSIMDPKLNGECDTNSVWKAVELAMSCVNPSSARRPNMTHVVMEINECLVAENARTGQSQEKDSKGSLELSMNFSTEIAPQAR